MSGPVILEPEVVYLNTDRGRDKSFVRLEDIEYKIVDSLVELMTEDPEQEYFGPKDVCKAVGMSRRQLQYWHTSGLIEAGDISEDDYEETSFSQMVYDRPQLLEVAIARALRDRNVLVETVHGIVPQVRYVAKEWGELPAYAVPGNFVVLRSYVDSTQAIDRLEVEVRKPRICIVT
ncbi:MAG: MerR family transcriptional regulator [Candidatus Nanoarchaeia archaeon]